MGPCPGAASGAGGHFKRICEAVLQNLNTKSQKTEIGTKMCSNESVACFVYVYKLSVLIYI